ncbi:SanA/YdcF family protein [Labilithrix luteola]|nr:ElyC/SanA/YdcF family protein [Labilithrix luteola]
MRKRRALTFLGALVAVAALVANLLVVSGGRDGRLEGPADCALVLGARVFADGSPSDILRDRLDESLAAYESGRVTRIVVSGDHRHASYDEPNAMRAYLEAHGVPPERIFMDHAGFDTYSSVWRAKHVFGASRIVVVTQRYHLSRALWVARSLGMEAEGRASDHHLYRGMAWYATREVVSRTKAVLDIALGREPRHAGPPISLDTDGRVTSG